jgi:hypothetical protein
VKKISQAQPNPSKDRAMRKGGNPLFWGGFIKFTFFLDSSIRIRIIKQVPKFLDTGSRDPRLLTVPMLRLQQKF